MRIATFLLVIMILGAIYPVRPQELKPFRIKGHKGEFIKLGSDIYRIPASDPSTILLSAIQEREVLIGGVTYIAHNGVLYKKPEAEPVGMALRIGKARISGEAETFKVGGSTYAIWAGNIYPLPSDLARALSFEPDTSKPLKFQVEGESYILLYGKIHRIPK